MDEYGILLIYTIFWGFYIYKLFNSDAQLINYYMHELQGVLMEPPVGFETTNIWYDNEGSEILNEPP